MTMDVSRLGIVVESTGIKEAATALQGRNGNGGLAGAADKAEQNVNKLTASLGKLLSVNTTAIAGAWAAAMGQFGTAVVQVGNQLQGITAQLNAATTGMNNMTGATQRATRAHEDHERGSHVVMNTLKALATVSTVYAAVNVAGSIVKQADAWQMMTARLQNATGSLNNAIVAQDQMFNLSQRLRVPLEDSVKLYTRLAPAVQRMGKDSGYAKDMVEGIATALQLGGANGAEASSVMLQLSQSFSSGTLNGAEFNAVAENGSVLMRALERATGKSTYELKKLGSEGKLSMKIVGQAIQDNLPLWRDQFDKLPLTFEGGVQRIKNAWTKAVGEMGQDTSFNQELSKSLRVIEDLIPAVARGLGGAFIEVMKWIQENKTFLGQIWEQVKGLAADVWGIAKAFVGFAGSVLEVGDDVSTVAKIIFLVRGAIQGIVDIVNVLRSAFVNVGLDIVQIILFPFQLTLKIVGDLERKLGDLFTTFANGARAIGMDKLAVALDSVAKGAKDYADNSKNINETLQATINKYRLMAAGWTADLDNGKGALQSFLDQSKKVDDTWDSILARRKKVMSMDDSFGSGVGKAGDAKDSKTAKAAAAEQKHFEDALVQANAALKAQEELTKRLTEYGLAYDKIGPAQKKVIELQENQIKLEGKGHTAAERAHNETLIAIYKETAAKEIYNERVKEGLQADQKVLGAAQEELKAIESAAQKAEDKLKEFGKAKGATDQDVLERLQNQLAGAQFEMDHSAYATPADVDNMAAMVEVMTRMVDAQERLTAANKGIGQNEAWAQFEKLMDPKKAEKFGDVLANGFGKAGKALGELMKGMQSYATRQAKITDLQKSYDKLTDGNQKAAAQKVLASETEKAWVETYADMAGAAKGFFEEGSRGYKTMQAVEQGFRLWQMAMQVKSFMQEIGLINAVTTTKIMSETTMSQASLSASETRISASMAEGQANAVTGVANQAKGDPYSAFIRMAAMAAAMAALGFAVSGAGGGASKHLSADRQASQGTGTVLGDDKAKSESIAKSLAYLSENSDIALRYSSGMLSSLQNIEASLTGATAGILRNPGDITGKGFKEITEEMGGIQRMISGIDLPLGNLISKIGGFGSSSKLVDSGITSGNQSVGDILSSGFDGQSYQDVEKSKKAFFITYGKSMSRNTQDLDPAITAEFTNVIEGMVGSIADAATALGFSGDEVTAKMKAVTIALGDISLKGLSAEEIQKELEAVFSAFGDKLTEAAFGDALTQFQKAGEGLLETAVRVATGVDQASYELEKLGLTAIDFRDIINTGGDVGAEIVRQSIMLQEQSTGIGEIINTMSGTAGDIAAVYKDLVNVRDSLSMLGIADDVTRELIRAAGGLDAMKDALASYTDNFFSDAEKNAMNAASLTKEFDKLGLAMPTTKEGFRDLVEQLSATGADGQALAIKVLLLSDAFSSLIDNSQAAIEDARNNLSDAYDRESQALTDTKERFEEFAKSLGDFKDNLLTGDLSTENPLEKYMLQKARYEDVKTRASAGDEQAMADFQSIATEFLNASRDVYASGDQYTADFQRVLMETTALQQDSEGKASVAEQSLDALNAQVEGLLTVNESVLSVADAIAALQEVMALGLGVEQVDGSHANGLANVPYDGYIAELHKGERVLTAEESRSYPDYSQYGTGNTTALVEEIKALRQEVCALKDGQREQTGQLIAANYDASARNADAIVEGHQDVARTTTYTERAQVRLA